MLSRTWYIKVRGFRLRNAIIVVFTIYSFIYMLHVSVVRPSSVEIYLSGNYTTDNGSVVIRILVTVMDNNSDRFQ
jgi:hypothetical protein